MEDRGSQAPDSAIPSEMEIVDCFTRLIFNAGDELTAGDRSILETLSLVDCNLALCEDPAEAGAYLRELGVREMIRLVGQVQEQYPAPGSTPAPARGATGAGTRSPASRGQPARA